MRQLETFVALAADLDGWFNPHSQATWDLLLCFQREQNIRGNLFEIGVHGGKSAALSTLHRAADEWHVYCDKVLQSGARGLLEGMNPDRSRFIEKDSTLLRVERDFDGIEPIFRWVHIDGHHSASVVARDLQLADQVLATDGILVVDDFFSVRYPQITASLFQYQQSHPFSFQPLLVGFNKGYFTRPLAARRYREYLRDRFYDEMTSSGYPRICIFKSTTPEDYNCFGFASAGAGEGGYFGLDSDPSEILI
ncbi:MAG: class I SAM-dependent methyltransferase [Pseudomonadota bacterium]